MILRSFNNRFIYYSFNPKRRSLNGLFFSFKPVKDEGYVKWNKISYFVYFVSEDKRPILQVPGAHWYYIDDVEVKIEIQQDKAISNLFLISKQGIILYKIKYYIFFSHLNMDYQDLIDFDFFSFIRNIWEGYHQQ